MIDSIVEKWTWQSMFKYSSSPIQILQIFFRKCYYEPSFMRRNVAVWAPTCWPDLAMILKLIDKLHVYTNCLMAAPVLVSYLLLPPQYVYKKLSYWWSPNRTDLIVHDIVNFNAGFYHGNYICLFDHNG